MSHMVLIKNILDWLLTGNTITQNPVVRPAASIDTYTYIKSGLETGSILRHELSFGKLAPVLSNNALNER